MTFTDGVGDTPDDWYVIYADPESHRLTALAYVVTYGKTLEEASTEPHAATYDGWKSIDALFVPTLLRFWNWSEADGLVGDPIGTATFTDLSFARADEGAFDAPSGAQRIEAPR